MKRTLCKVISGALIISMVCSVPVRSEETGGVFLMDDAALKEETDRGGIPVSSSVNLVKEEQDLPYYMNDMVGHGTAVADIIYQICPKAQIYSVRVLDKDNKGRLSDIVEGIYWYIEHGKLL